MHQSINIWVVRCRGFSRVRSAPRRVAASSPSTSPGRHLRLHLKYHFFYILTAFTPRWRPAWFGCGRRPPVHRRPVTRGLAMQHPGPRFPRYASRCPATRTRRKGPAKQSELREVFNHADNERESNAKTTVLTTTGFSLLCGRTFATKVLGKQLTRACSGMLALNMRRGVGKAAGNKQSNGRSEGRP